MIFHRKVLAQARRPPSTNEESDNNVIIKRNGTSSDQLRRTGSRDDEAECSLDRLTTGRNNILLKAIHPHYLMLWAILLFALLIIHTAYYSNQDDRLANHKRSLGSPISTRTKNLHSQQQPHHTQQCLVFFHLPKCGGSSLSQALGSLAFEKGWKRIFAPSNMNRPDIDQVPIHHQSAMYVGHLFPSFLDMTNTTDCLQVTMLRDPIDRAMSHFYYWNLEDKDWDAVGKIDQECSESPSPNKIRSYNQLSNNMVRHLGMQFEGGIWTNHQNRSMACQYANIGDEHLERAKTVLKEMDLVCFVDDFEGCLQQLRQLLRLPRKTKIQVPKSNQGGGGSKRRRSSTTVTQKDNNAYARALKNTKRRKEVASFNGADIVLYHYALKEFGSPVQSKRSFLQN